ncbi:hypothetical protein LTV02_21385 [Nocardia yamanashiensis]|uniref:hypothetical protein n=1 Tax=Nocardia yamanashiensis TaxID=209247 RepID=UPI0008309D35|nr:hypothetical protein [Nocardia yamanashiensis]UGT38682.1 hypothetical protein LTV02_21385 [Nocardia yamanashiensis]
MKKFAAVIAISAGLAGLSMGTAHAEELIGNGNYGTLEACDIDGSKGSWVGPNGQQITGDAGWWYQCQQHDDGLWYVHLFR